MNDVYINRNLSTLIKGLAIILVVIGHNKMIIPVGSDMYHYLYSFHIYVFFILPFFYEKSNRTFKGKALRTVIKCWWPYMIFYVAIFSFTLLMNKEWSITAFVKGFLNIGGENPGTVCGATFLWFLPSYCSFILEKELLEKSNYLKYIILSFSCVLLIDQATTWHVFYKFIPLYIARGLFYIPFAWLTTLFLNRIKRSYFIGVLLFLLLSINYWIGYREEHIYHLLAISGFIAILSTARFVDSYLNGTILMRCISFFGKYSLPIYLVHQFSYNVLYKLLPPSTMCGYAITIITLLLSLGISVIICNSKLNSFLFPKCLDDLRTCFKYEK